MGVISKFEGGIDNAMDRAAGAVFRGPIEPAQIAKRAEKQMKHEKLVGAGKQYAPTLYTVLVNKSDDRKLYAFYPTMAAEIETYLVAKGTSSGLKFDGRPLVRFIVDKNLKSGKFDVVAENVSAPTIAKLRREELEYYGLAEKRSSSSFSHKRGAQSGPLSSDSQDPPPLVTKARLTDLNAGKSYAFTQTTMILGRDSGCDIVIDDANISRRHAQFTCDVAGSWKVSDLDSTNGTKLNGNPVRSAMLRDGDQIMLGITLLEFREH